MSHLQLLEKLLLKKQTYVCIKYHFNFKADMRRFKAFLFLDNKLYLEGVKRVLKGSYESLKMMYIKNILHCYSNRKNNIKIYMLLNSLIRRFKTLYILNYKLYYKYI